jgi:hypothetical protein
MCSWRSHRVLLVVGLVLLLSGCKGQVHVLRVTVSSKGGCWAPLFDEAIQHETFTVRQQDNGVDKGKLLATTGSPTLLACDSFMAVFPGVPNADFYGVWNEIRGTHWGPFSYKDMLASNWNIRLIWPSGIGGG